MEKINIAEILRDCPQGMKLYSPVCGECTLKSVDDDPKFPITVYITEDPPFYFTADGRYIYNQPDAECVLFPSKDQRDWSKFQRPFKDGDIVVNASNEYSNAFIYAGEGDDCYYSYVGLFTGTDTVLSTNKSLAWVSKKKGIRFATEDEKQKLFDAIKDKGYKWNEETKTLEKLVVPKFKVGDKVRHKITMAQLAIRGHATRGREVIELLEMLGGENPDEYKGYSINRYYYIDDELRIDWCHECTPDSDFVSYTLEEFLEKFPYKVGDKVYYDNKVCDVIELFWNSNLNTICYGVYDGKIKNLAIVDELQPYKEETMEDKGTLEVIDLTRELRVADEVEIILGDYEFVLKDGKTYFVKRKPQYPKTYDECCKELGHPQTLLVDRILGYKGTLLSVFQQLLICRDAYWKIAGEQMGLGEPWGPDWLNTEQDKFVLYTHDNVICLNRFVLGHNVLAFPTAEIRDAFLENFKELIEECKELL